MQAVHHWDVLADDVAKEVKLTLQGRGLLGEQIYLKPRKRSDFGNVFGTLLTTQLFNQVIELSNNESNSIKLTYRTQKVKHRAKRFTSPLYPGEALLLTALGHGVYKAFADNSDALGLFAAAGTAEIINGLEHDWTVPHYEIVITTELTTNDSVIVRSSNIYYINDEDSWHYANSWHNWGEEKELPTKKYSFVSK
jgi:hypothetical protein